MTHLFRTRLLAIVFALALPVAMWPGRSAAGEDIEPRRVTALEEVVRDRDSIKNTCRNGSRGDSATGRSYTFDAGIPMAEGWLFLQGGSFGICSDDIVVFALFHPAKDILRILYASYTGTVESGRFLIDQEGRSVVVSRECLGNEPPRRFAIRNGIPVEDIAFRNAFSEAFANIATVLKLPPGRCWYTRELPFHGSDRTPQLELTIRPESDASPMRECTISMIYADGKVIMTPPAVAP